QATARYGYTQPCALYSLGKKGQTTTVDGAGTMNARSENGTVRYVIQVTDPERDINLKLTAATVNGRRSTEARRDSQPEHPVLRALLDFFWGRFQESRRLEAALESFFGNDQFGRDLCAELNKHLKLARERSRS